MSARVSKIADVLLTAATEPRLVEMLFNRCENVGRPVGSVISESTAMHTYKGPLDKVLAIASDQGTPPRVLERFARDPRVSVRAALLSNPSTPHSAIVSLVTYVMQRRERSEIAPLVGRLAPEEIASALRIIPVRDRKRLDADSTYGRFPSSEIVSRLLPADRDVVLDVVSLGYPGVNTVFAYEAYQGRATVTLSEVIEATDPALRGHVISKTAASGTILTCELAEILTRLDPKISDTRFAMVEQGALEILVHHPHPVLFAAALRLGVPNTELTDVIVNLDPPRLHQLLDPSNGVVPGRLTPDQEVALVERHLDLQTANPHQVPTGLSARLLALLSRPLPRTLALRFICGSTLDVVGAWVAGRFPEKPAHGEVLAVITELESARTGRHLDPVRRVLRRELASAVGTPWEDDVAELLDGELAEFNDSALAGFITARVMARIGHDTSAWDTMMGLAQDWDLGLAALLDATVALHPDAVPDPEAASEPEQQQLFDW